MSIERNTDIEIRLLIEAIYLKYSYDFRDYSGASIKRRVLHAVRQFECATVSALQERVLHDPSVFMQLLQYLTIPVSEMFRDPSYFLTLREQVVPLLHTYPSLKIWVAGCSTGEEVYSLAILLHEEGLLERTMIYATDINPHSLEKAEQGIFALDHLRAYTENYQLSLGGSEAEDVSLAKITGPGFDEDGIVDAVERVTEKYKELREGGERFVDTYRRVGAEPFKEAVYG